MTIGIIHSSKPMTMQAKMDALASRAAMTMQAKMDAFNKELSNIAGLEALKSQLQSWAKQLMLDERRRALGLKVGDRKPPHMAFLGNPGTGKTMVARLLGKILHMLDIIIPTEKVVEVQRTDLVGEYIGRTGPRTRAKIQEAAEGGILFVDEAYRLMPDNRHYHDYGIEALEEIMSFMDSGKVVVIFAGYSEQMERVVSANEGFRRRVTKFFHFDDFTCTDLANIIRLKMSNNQKSPLCGFKLHASCTLSIIAEIIREGSTEKLRKEMNGGLVDMMLVNAKENLDKRMDVECGDIDALTTITLDDLRAGLRLIKQFEHRRGQTIIGGSPATASSQDPSASDPNKVFLSINRTNKSAFGTGSYGKTENPRVVKLQTEVTDFQDQLSMMQALVQQIRILNNCGQPPTPLFVPQHP